MPRIRDMLDGFNSDELTAIVERMVRRHPDLMDVVRTPAPARAGCLDAGDITRQIDVALEHAVRGGWREAIASSKTLAELADLGREYVAADEVENAVVIVATLVDRVISHYEMVQDSESEIAVVIDQCISVLEAALARCTGEPRRIALAAVLDATIWGHSYGVADDGPRVLLEHATGTERDALSDGSERRLAIATSESARRFVGQLFVRLRGGLTDAEVQLDHYRRTCNRGELVRGLLTLHRPDEAADILADVERWSELGPLADDFVQRGYVGHAIRALESLIELPQFPNRSAALQWLYHRAVEAGDADVAARRAEELCWESPGVPHWLLLRASVNASRRTEIRHRLAAERKFLLLTEVLLAENKARWALTPYRKIEHRTPEVLQLGARIADGLFASKPRVAAQLWLDAAEQLLARDHHEDDKQAVRFVGFGYDALSEAGHPVLAKRHVAEFRLRHRNRRLLQDALTALGLP